MPRSVTFLTRPACSLCADALAKLRTVSRLLGIDLRVHDITADPDLEDEYHLRIPVVLDANGSVIAEGPLTTWAVFRALVVVRLRR